MLGLKKYTNRGDTLIEVLFATAVFSLVAVGALSVMNQGAATSQRALEISLVRQEIDAQAETLRFINASYINAYQSGVVDYSGTPANEWPLIKARSPSNVSVSSLNNCNPRSNINSFILNTHSAKFVPPVGANRPINATTFSQVKYNNPSPGNYTFSSAEGIWIEAISSDIDITNNQGNAGYIDFHIRACWDSPGQTTHVTLGTIVRLYEPL